MFQRICKLQLPKARTLIGWFCGWGREGIPVSFLRSLFDNPAGAGDEEDVIIVFQIAVNGVALPVDRVVDGETGWIGGVGLTGEKREKSVGVEVDAAVFPGARVGPGGHRLG